LHSVEIKIDHRRGVERQELAQREAADHGVAERLAQLRSRAVTERERKAREHRGRRRHQDRAEAQQAGFADRRDRRHAIVAFGRDGEIDQHDAVLLDDADQEDDADDADHREVHMAELQRQQRADAGRRQRGQDRQRMDEALVEYAEDDVDDDERRGDQRRFARERGLERLRVALEGSDHRRRHADLARGLRDRVDGFAERHAGLQVEAQRDRRKPPLVRDRERPNLAGIDLDQRRQRHGGAGERRFHVQAIERGEVALLVGRDLEDDPIGLELGEILRDLTLAEGVVEGVVDHLRRDAEAGRLVAVDADLELGRVRQEIARHVGELRQRAHLLEQLIRALVELCDVGVLQRVLKTGAGDAAADGDVLGRLQEERRTLNLRELRPQPVDDLRGGELALVARLEHDEEAPGVGGVGAAGAAGERAEAGDVRIAQQHRAELAQDAHHLLGGRILGGFGKALDHAGVLDREEAFRNLKGHDHGQRHGGEENPQRDRLVAEHDVERALVERQHRIEARLDGAVHAAVVFRLAMHEARAQHRRERERDQRRHRDRGGDGEGEFADTAIEAVTVSGNSRNMRPMMPPMSKSGMNTATSDRLIESTVKPISREPLSAASNGAAPSSMWRWMFSTTTMASSTTKPTAMVSAISGKLSRLKLKTYIAAHEPSSASGTGMLGITLAPKPRRNSRTTSTTRAMVSASVNWTSCTEARMVVVRSRMVSTLMAGGIRAVSCGSSALIWSTVSMTLAPGCLKTASMMPRLLF